MKWKLDSSYLTLPEVFYTEIVTSSVPDGKVVILNQQLARDLGLGDFLEEADQAIFAGSQPPPGARVFAQAYAGHQYGHFTNLGDGRAAVLGEILSPKGERWDLQLKGSGPTPYSRRGDGKAALGPMLREYLVSEFMAALGIPTTRSLAVATTGEKVRRETSLPGAVLTRAAASHIRIGTFEFAAAQDDLGILQKLTDYTVNRHYPFLKNHPAPALALWDAVAQAQADLVARWMAAGFVHGVMNTDNVAISGQTIDYGPCAFLDTYSPAKVFSSIDLHGRYAYGRQGAVIGWNLARFAEALLPLIDTDSEKALLLAQYRLKNFEVHFQERALHRLGQKLGLSQSRSGDGELLQSLFSWMEDVGADFTLTFRSLTSLISGTGSEKDAPVPPSSWIGKWRDRLREEREPARLMLSVNPVYIPRNYWLQQALDEAEQGNREPFFRLLEAVQNPFLKVTGLEELETAGPLNEEKFVTYCGT